MLCAKTFNLMELHNIISALRFISSRSLHKPHGFDADCTAAQASELEG